VSYCVLRVADLLVAVVTDIHGNLTAFEAVLADIHRMSPDLVLHGGDLADPGSSPIDLVDRIRDLGWRGVMGNTDEMLVRPSSLEDFASQSSAPSTMWSTIRLIASSTRSKLGDQRLKWLSELPLVTTVPGFALVHAEPGNCWRAPSSEATDAELETIYGSLGQPIVAYGHTHRPELSLRLLGSRNSTVRRLVPLRDLKKRRVRIGTRPLCKSHGDTSRARITVLDHHVHVEIVGVPILVC
jgi:predicted phosphodiesterase